MTVNKLVDNGFLHTILYTLIPANGYDSRVEYLPGTFSTYPNKAI